MELALALAYWFLRLGASFPRHAAAILTAIAVPVVASVLLEDTRVIGEVGAVLMLSAVVLGIAIGVRLEHLGRGSHKWRDWSVVIVGAVLGLVAVFGFVLFLALFGTLLGLYWAAAALGVWLALRLGLAGIRMVSSQREGPA